MSTDKLPPNPGIKVITVSAEQAMQARNAYLEKEKAFFDSWKQGVSLAGYQYFGDGTLEGFENAKNKNDLRPSSEKIKATFGMKGDSEVAFLVAMYCFYNDIRGAQLSTEAGVITLLGHIMAFDIERREVIADLIMNYVGW